MTLSYDTETGEWSGQYIKFKILSSLARTRIFTVESLTQGGVLGRVMWHSAWRQYCFFPEPRTHWSKGCLQDVQDFIFELMEERKETRLENALKGWKPEPDGVMTGQAAERWRRDTR